MCVRASVRASEPPEVFKTLEKTQFLQPLRERIGGCLNGGERGGERIAPGVVAVPHEARRLPDPCRRLLDDPAEPDQPREPRAFDVAVEQAWKGVSGTTPLARDVANRV